MKILTALLSFLFVGLFSLNAQFLSTKGAKQAGTGGGGILISDVWSNFNNQAGLAKTEGITAGAYFQNRFDLSDLGDKAVAVSFKTDKYGAVGLSYSYYGNSTYNTSTMGFSYAKQLGKRFYAGMRVNYLSAYITGDYGSAGSLTGDIGILAEPTEKLVMAAYVSNPRQASNDESAVDDLMPLTFKLAMGYHFTDELFCSLQADKDIDIDGVIVHSGVDYTLIENLSLQAGIAFSQDYTEYSFGAGYIWKGVSLDFAFSNHPILGFSPQFALGYNFKTSKKTAEE